MKDNTIIDKIARTIERKELGKGGITPLPFVYADLGMQNVVFDNIEPPFAAAVPLATGTAEDERGMYHEEVTLAVFFGDIMCQQEVDFDARHNERIIDECKQRAFQWLSSLVPTKEIELVSVNQCERAYQRADAIVTGYVVSVTLREVQGYGRCGFGTIQ